jgi:hypothetical protein
MEDWLRERAFTTSDHWKFARAHFWENIGTVLCTPHLLPDWQTRLSVREKAGGRVGVHAGSPFGGGTEAPVLIEHHKFLVHGFAERLAIAETYDRYHEGYGTGNMLPFSIPELAYAGTRVELRAPGLGEYPWTPAWTREEQW